MRPRTPNPPIAHKSSFLHSLVHASLFLLHSPVHASSAFGIVWPTCSLAVVLQLADWFKLRPLSHKICSDLDQIQQRCAEQDEGMTRWYAHRSHHDSHHIGNSNACGHIA